MKPRPPYIKPHQTRNSLGELQALVVQRTQALEREKQKALELHRAKGIFLSRMSHEMRTPLTAINGYAELLGENESLSPAERKKYCTVISDNARQLLEMIDETLDMITVEQDRYRIREQEFYLRLLISDVIDTYQVLAKRKGLRLEQWVDPELPEKLYSDPKAIRQVLTNLIGNAIKFTTRGFVRVKVRLRSLPNQRGQKIYFYITDSGEGIPPEHHRRIFRAFEQYLDPHETHERGTGLGLAISCQLARLLGGDVRLRQSAPKQGSTFMFSLLVRGKPVSNSIK